MISLSSKSSVSVLVVVAALSAAFIAYSRNGIAGESKCCVAPERECTYNGQCYSNGACVAAPGGAQHCVIDGSGCRWSSGC
jgi:hypothetical protein